MKRGEIPPVPVGPQFPGAGGRVRLNIPVDGHSAKLSPLKGTRVDERVGAVIARVAGLLLAGHEYPLFEARVLECWVREARPGFLKIDFDQMTIICASLVKGEQCGRVLHALVNSHYLSSIQTPSEMFSFTPIVKAGLFDEVIYYIESPSLPEVIFPDLVVDSLRFTRFLIAEPDSPSGVEDSAAYIESLVKGEDPGNWVSFEPFFRDLLDEMSDEQASQFIMQLGEQIRLMGAKDNADHRTEAEEISPTFGERIARRFNRFK